MPRLPVPSTGNMAPAPHPPPGEMNLQNLQVFYSHYSAISRRLTSWGDEQFGGRSWADQFRMYLDRKSHLPSIITSLANLKASMANAQPAPPEFDEARCDYFRGHIDNTQLIAATLYEQLRVWFMHQSRQQQQLINANDQTSRLATQFQNMPSLGESSSSRRNG